MPNASVAKLKRKAAAVRHRLTRPTKFRSGAGGVRFLMPEYYEAQLGMSFSSATEAEQHYADHGWRLGLLPHPYLHAPAARVSVKDAQSLRDAMVGLAGGRPLPPRWLRPSPRLDLATLTARFPESLAHPGGVGTYLLTAGPTAGSAAIVRVGPEEDPPKVVPTNDERPEFGAAGVLLTVDEFAAHLRGRVDLVRTILDQDLFDDSYFEAQVGSSFLSTEAALHHYVEVGEEAGYGPHPFFEPEWYRAFSDGEPPAERFLDFIAHGATGPAGPHFDGGGELSLGEFLASSDAESPTRAGHWTVPASRSTVEAAAGRRAREFRTEHSSRRRGSAVLPRHITKAPTGEVSGEHLRVLIVLDGRSLRTVREPETSIASVLGQEHQAWELIILTRPDASPTEKSAVATLAEADSRIHVDMRRSTETFGAAVDRVRAAGPIDAVAFWHPSHTWSRGFLTAASTALAAVPESAAAVSPGRGRPHAWLTREDPLWLNLEVAAGVLVRSDAFGEEPLVDPSLDGGIEWDLMLRLAPAHTCVLLPENLLSVEQIPKPADLTATRRWSNEVRSRRLVPDGQKNPRVPGRSSILIPTFQDWWMTCRVVHEVLETTVGLDLEVCVVDNGSRRAVSSIIATAFSGDERVRLTRLPRNCDFALGSNVALANSTGEFAVFLNNDITATDDWLPPLLESLRSGAAAAQPLLTYPNSTIQTAGTVFFGAAVPPAHLLTGFPAEDAVEALADREFSALTAACLAIRASDAEALDGFDTRYVNGMEDVDFCLRLGDLTGKPLRLVPTSVLWHHESVSPRRFARVDPNRTQFVDRWRHRLVDGLDDSDVLDKTHLRVAGPVSRRLSKPSAIRTSGLTYARPARTVSTGPGLGLPALRWSIKIAAPPGRRGNIWGDVFFAHDLAAGLRTLGQEVVIDRSQSHVRPDSDHLDDVTLTLRGLAPFQPQPSATNLLWVISHPDRVTDAELESGWDAVYSAGAAWAESKSAELDLDIRTLLQATNPERFHPADPGANESTTADVTDVLFVGRTRRVFRPIVRDAIAVGADLSVYGDDGWEELIAARFHKGINVPNDQLPEFYRQARIVLNDHWADMAAHGFISNRLFDAAAAGSLVVSDDAIGIESIFGPTVRTYRTLDELRQLLDPDADIWPSDDERRAEGARIGREHSFAVRARTLVADVMDLRGVAHDLR